MTGCRCPAELVGNWGPNITREHTRWIGITSYSATKVGITTGSEMQGSTVLWEGGSLRHWTSASWREKSSLSCVPSGVDKVKNIKWKSDGHEGRKHRREKGIRVEEEEYELEQCQFLNELLPVTGGSSSKVPYRRCQVCEWIAKTKQKQKERLDFELVISLAFTNYVTQRWQNAMISA